MKKKTIAPDVLASIKATPQPRKRSHLTPRSMRLALEPRILFDAAAASAAVENFTDTALDAPPAPESQQAEAAATPDNSAIDTGAQGAASGLLLYADAEVQAIPNLGASAAYVQARLAAWAASGNFSTDAAALFSANAGSESWMANAELLRGALTGGEYALRVESRPSAELQGMLAAYSPTGTTGQPTIYLNADWLATASVEAITPVLFEEIGHDFDHRLNGANDTQGDEGHAFASLMVTGDANQAAVAGEDDHRTLLLSGQAVVVESAGPYAVAQITFVPLPEQELNQALRLISPTDANANNNIESIIAFTVTSNNTIVVYDHWEDGYEADIKNPVQSTTLIWGDGNTANGTAPGTANDILTTGQTIVLRNTVNITTTQTVIDFDGKDKIGSSKAITTTRAGWNSGIGSILAGAVNVFDTGTAGSTYVIPVGTNTVAAGGTFTTVANPTLFESSTVHIMAFEDGTVVNIDKDANGTFETVVTLNQGGTYVATGVVAGAKINTVGGKNVGVYMINGDIAPPGYENRWFSIAPREDWSDDYYSPVGTTSTTLQPGYAFLYNPNATAITVNVETLNTSGVKVTTPIAIAANSSKYFQMPASAAHFKSADGSKYYAVQVMDGASGSSTDVDWSFALVPETYLTDRLVAAFAPGSASTPPSTAPLNGSPLWVTPVADTFLYLDHAAITASTFTVKDALGNVVAGTAVDGDTYKYPVKVLQSYRITDNTDKDQSGTMMYTVDGTFLAGAWGEDGSVAGPASPYLDMGNALLPFPDYTLTKTSKEASPAQFPGASNGDGKVQLGEQIEYTLTVVNKSVVDLFNILFQDNPANLTSATYVANSATLTVFDRNGNVIRSVTDLDGVTNTFPLSGAGYVLDDANS